METLGIYLHEICLLILLHAYICNYTSFMWKKMGFMAVFDNVKASDSLSQCVLCIKIFNILKRESHTFWAIYYEIQKTWMFRVILSSGFPYLNSLPLLRWEGSLRFLPRIPSFHPFDSFAVRSGIAGLSGVFLDPNLFDHSLHRIACNEWG